MINIQSVRDGYKNMEISNIGFTRSQKNPADAFTKIMNGKNLIRIVEYGKADMPVDQWVIRKEKRGSVDNSDKC